MDRAANELVVLLEADVRNRMRAASWQRYQHTFGSASAGGDLGGIELDSDLMRLATGASALD
jgi:FMN reductase